MKEQLKKEAYQEYLKEKDQVDTVIHKMIEEDQQIMSMNKQKQDQAKQDMIMSVTEKRDMLRREKQQQEYETEQLQRYAQQQ